MEPVTTLSVPVSSNQREMRSITRIRNRMMNRITLLLGILKPVLGNIAAMPLTVAGFGCIDCGVFFASIIAGFIVTGISLILLEFVISDDDS